MRADNEMLIGELTNSNDDLNRRNSDVMAGTEASNKQNAELKSANAVSCKRIEELSAGIEALKRQNNQYVADIAGLNRRIEELAHNNEILNSRFNGATNEITTLRGQLEQETQLRKVIESRLNRLLYGQYDEGTAFNRSLAPLLLCCDRVPNVTVEEAVFGQPSQLGSNCLLVHLLRQDCSIDYIRLQIAVHRSELEGLVFATRLLSNSASQTLTLEHLLAIRMYTFGNRQLKLYTAVNAPFYDPERSPESLANQLPFVRLLIRSLRALGKATKFETGITVYRGASTENSPYLQQIYESFINNASGSNLQPGGLLRFPSFTSSSTDCQHAKDEFGDDFVYEIRLNHEVRPFSIILFRLTDSEIPSTMPDWS
jgi:FtsZ-binding cell division protein ZapB